MYLYCDFWPLNNDRLNLHKNLYNIRKLRNNNCHSWAWVTCEEPRQKQTQNNNFARALYFFNHISLPSLWGNEEFLFLYLSWMPSLNPGLQPKETIRTISIIIQSLEFKSNFCKEMYLKLNYMRMNSPEGKQRLLSLSFLYQKVITVRQ